MDTLKLAKTFYREIDQIDNAFDTELKKWNAPAKLVVLAEAPLSSSKYFYIRQGGFLSLLKKHYSFGKNSFLDFLRDKGILVVDIYKFPIPSEFYDYDKSNILYDDGYICDKLNRLRSDNIVNDDTRFIYRYKKLIVRKLFLQKALSGLNYIMVNGQHESLGIKANSMTLNNKIIQYLP